MSLFFETKRSKLPDSVFGVPEQRKFPLDSEEHVRSAIKFFNYVDPKYEKELANNIKKAMKKYNINDVKIGEKNRLSKYIKSTSDKSVKEAVDLSKDLENKRIILDKTISLLSQELGKNVKINKNDENDFLHKSSKKLCFCGLGQNPDHICSIINKEIKPYGGRLKPDNYGTAFLSVKESYDESSVLVIESVEGDEDSYEFYASYRVEPIYKDPSNCCWDEEMYNSNVPDAIVSLINKNKNINSGNFYVYTDMGVGKTKFIGVIEIQVDQTSNFEYFWKKKINTIKEIFENTASGAMVGTGGNLYISGCMKKNTFVDTDQQEKMEYIVHRDGMNDMFMFKDKKAKKMTREELSKNYNVVECYCLDDPFYTENFLQVINKSHDINEFYTLLMGDNNTQRSFKDDIRFEQTIPFLDILSKIQRNLLCEFRMIKKEKYPNNNLIIERVDRNIQSLIDSPYCLETVFPVKEINEDVRNKMMVEQLKTLKEIIPTIK